jgi:hypothetical protein
VEKKMNQAPEPEDKLDATTTVVVNGPEDAPFDWHAVDWRRVEDDVRRLRQRIFTASKAGDLKRVRSLQKLMLRSRANTLVSVRRVTERNAGRLTAGVDGEVVLTPEAKARLAERVHQNTEPFKALPVRRVYIPKPGSRKRRPLGIPVIADRCHQARVAAALELTDSQDGRCAICRGLLFTVEDRPQNPREWEKWLATRTAVITTAARPGDPEEAAPRLLHTDCRKQLGPELRDAYEPSGLA